MDREETIRIDERNGIGKGWVFPLTPHPYPLSAGESIAWSVLWFARLGEDLQDLKL